MNRIFQSRDEHMLIGTMVLSEGKSCIEAHQEPPDRKHCFCLVSILIEMATESILSASISSRISAKSLATSQLALMSDGWAQLG